MRGAYPILILYLVLGAIAIAQIVKTLMQWKGA